MSQTQKSYFAKIYQPTVSGTTTSGILATLKDFVFRGFTWGINAGLGECNIRLPRSFQSFGEGADIGLFNQFDIYIQDKESGQNGLKIYSGYIVEYEPVLSQHEEYLDVTLWGYPTEFAVKMLETGTDTTIAYSSQDPSDILRDVLRRYDGKVIGETNASPLYNPSSSAVAGVTARSTTNEAWGAIRGGVGTGGGAVTPAATILCGSTSNNFNQIRRGVVLFDTSSLPDTAQIISATLSLYCSSVGNSLSQSLAIVSHNPPSNSAVDDTNYPSGRFGAARYATDVSLGSITAAAYNDFPLSATGRAALSLTDVTKIGLLLSGDADNSPPTWSSGAYSEVVFEGYTDTHPPKLTITYRVGSIISTATVVSYTFKQNTILEAVDQCLKMAPAYWFWRVGADNQLVFTQRDTNTINHTLLIGRDIISIGLKRSGMQLRNAYYFLGGGSPLYIKTNRSTSQTTYGKRIERAQDERVTDQTTAGIIAGAFLDQADHPLVLAEVVVADSNGNAGGYDIELFKPGDVVKLSDPNQDPHETLWDVALWDVDFWDYPITSVLGVPWQIISVSYELNQATLQLAFEPTDVAKRIEDIKRNLEANRTANTPTTPTVV